MTSIHQILNGSPSDRSSFFLGVVEIDNVLLVGILDEPVGVELSAVRLAYPIEIIQKWDGGLVRQRLIVPETGVPDEVVIDAGAIEVFSGHSDFAATYFKNLGELVRIRPSEYKVEKCSRADIFKGGNGNGNEERLRGP